MLRLIPVTAVFTSALFAQDGYTRAIDAAREALQKSRYGEAQKHLEEAAQETLKFPANDVRTAQVYEAMVELQALQGSYEPAESLAKQSLAIREAVLGAESVELAPYLVRLAAIERAAGKPEAAVPLIQRAIEIHE